MKIVVKGNLHFSVEGLALENREEKFNEVWERVAGLKGIEMIDYDAIEKEDLGYCENITYLVYDENDDTTDDAIYQVEVFMFDDRADVYMDPLQSY